MGFSAGQWTLRRCLDDACGLIWLDPMPLESEINKAYVGYYTHTHEAKPDLLRAIFRRAKVALATLLGLRRTQLRANVMYLDDTKPGKLLDVGCGNGSFLKRMREKGWNAEGLDFDPLAIERAQSDGLHARLGDLTTMGYPANSFNAITMNHVIEHVGNPEAYIAECWRILAPGGKLIVVTPNNRSWGHHLFGRNWRDLDPPRHLHVFSSKSLLRIARRAGFSDFTSRTSAANAEVVFLGSTRICEHGFHSLTLSEPSVSRSLRSLYLQYREASKMLRDPTLGEEIVLIAIKH